MVSIADRDIRQRELIPPPKLLETKATVVGVGAIGRQVAIQLAAIGVPRLTIIDFDDVNVENLGSQGFYESDVGLPKVKATTQTCRSINPSISINSLNSRFRPLCFVSGILFCCVDSIEVRKSIFEATKDKFDLFIDGRMSAEYLRIITVHDNESTKYYPSTLFKPNEAYRGSCTAKTTIYCANIAAGMMIAQFTKWLREYPIDTDVDINLLTNEMGVK